MKKKPDWTLCVKVGEKWQKVGAAWNTERGNISIRLDSTVQAGNFMAFPYREQWGGREQGGYPKGHPGNVRAGESMEQYFRRRRATVNSWPSAEDYMEQQRQARQEKLRVDKPTDTPLNHDDDCPDPEAPDWL